MNKLSKTLKDADDCISDSGAKLRGKVKKFAGGGKVTSLAALSKKFLSALEMDDTELVKRVGRQLDSEKPGTSGELRRRATERGAESSRVKLSTFQKGGKV